MKTGPCTLSIAIIGTLAFTLLLLAQILLFEERMIVDSAVSTFVICNTQNFDVEEARYALALNQVLPVIATYFTTDVRWVVAAFYANDYLWYLGFFLLFLFGFKQPIAALALIVGYFTSINYNYFVLPYCVPLTWPLLILLILILQQKIWVDKNWLRWPITFVCLFFLAFSSPITTVTTSFFLAYLWADAWQNHMPRKPIILTTLVFIGMVITKAANLDPYDAKRISAFAYNDLDQVNWPYIKHWLKDFLIAFPIGTVLLFSGAFLAIKKWQQGKQITSLILLGAFGYLATVFVLYGVILKSPYDEISSKAFAPTLLLLSFVLISKLVNSGVLNNRRIAIGFASFVIVLVGIKFGLLLGPYSSFAREKVAISKELIEQVPDDGSRYYVYEGSYAGHRIVPQINSTEIIITSALLDNGPYDAHIVVADSAEIRELHQLNPYEIYHMPGSFYEIEEGDRFFNFKTDEDWEEYHPVIN